MPREISPHAATAGWVALVGGGPGSSGLITARGLELLGQADVVVVDALAPRDLLEDLGPGTEVIDASKRRGRHVMSQEEIDALLVDLAGRGKGVVRLKGGDPYVLGRGGEEAAACRKAGVAVEVVPGITSATQPPVEPMGACGEISWVMPQPLPEEAAAAGSPLPAPASCTIPAPSVPPSWASMRRKAPSDRETE